MVCYGQQGLFLSQGGTNQTNYYTVIPYEEVNGKMIVSATIEGKSYRFIFDTGAPMTISKELNDQLNLKILTKNTITDANGKKDSVFFGSLKKIEMGGLLFENIPTFLTPTKNIIFDCFNVDGFIGSNLLRNSIVQFNDSTKQIIITDEEKKLSLNPKHSSKLKLTNQSNPIITVTFRNKRKLKGEILFDTGYNGFLDFPKNSFDLFQKYDLFKVLAKANGSSGLSMFGVPNDAMQYNLLVKEMKMNEVSFVNINTNTGTDNDFKIGSKLMKYGVVTVDYKNKKFYFDPNFVQEKNLSKPQLPFGLKLENDRIVIGFVWDENIKDRIQVGDRVLKIDDVIVENMNTCDAIAKSSIFQGKNKFTLTTKNSKGEQVQTIIERK